MSGDGSDTVMNLPLAGELTYNEAHAMLLGLLGILAPIAIELGFTSLAVYGSLFLIAIPFGIEEAVLKTILRSRGEGAAERCRRSPIGRRLLRIEPWYFLTVYILSAIGTELVIEFGGLA